MNWIILIGIAVVCDAIRVFIDNYVTDVHFKKRSSVAQKYFYGVAYIVTTLLFFIVTGISFAELNYLSVFVLIAAGIISAISGITYFRAMEIEDTTDVAIFFQLMPVLYLIAGWLFLGERIGPLQLAAFAVILSAPLLIVITARKRSRKVKLRAVMYILLNIILAITGNMMFLTVDPGPLNVYQEIAFLLLGKGIGNVCIVLFSPKLHRRWNNVLKSSHYKILLPMLVDHGVGMVYEVLYRAALTMAPAVAIASAASDATEPIVIFFLGLLFTLIWPNFGREKLDRKTVLVHLGATALVVIGIVMLQF